MKCNACGSPRVTRTFRTPYSGTNRHQSRRKPCHWCDECWADNVARNDASRRASTIQTLAQMLPTMRDLGLESSVRAQADELGVDFADVEAAARQGGAR